MLGQFLNYEDRLNGDFTWALLQGSMHFAECNEVFKSLRSLTGRLDQLEIEYAVTGGIALFRHGYRRFTENIDVLIESASFEKICQQLIGHGYRKSGENQRWLRDDETGVRIGLQKSGVQDWARGRVDIEFPQPRAVAADIHGTRCVSPSALIDIKLMSGLAGQARLRDLADIQELIKSIRLPREYVKNLRPVVQPTFLEVWCEPEPDE